MNTGLKVKARKLKSSTLLDSVFALLIISLSFSSFYTIYNQCLSGNGESIRQKAWLLAGELLSERPEHTESRSIWKGDYRVTVLQEKFQGMDGLMVRKVIVVLRGKKILERCLILRNERQLIN